VLIVGCAAPREAERRFEFSRLAMGVEARIVLFAGSQDAAVSAARAAFARIEELEAAFSDWRADSELSRLCAQAGGEPVPVSDDLFTILQRAREISEATDGVFDVTVGPLVRLWRAARQSRRLPEAGELDAARENVGWQLVELDGSRRTVQLARPGMRLDLGGVGKGWACQAAIELLAERDVPRALVQMGGDVVCGDPPPDRDGWEVEVGGRTILVAHRAVSTSGDTEQHVVIDGQRYSHVIDPRTGIGRTDRTITTVAAPDGGTADALSKAVGWMPDRDMQRVLRRFGAEVLRHERVP
jgi:thiamine biosynthesis lipoprotein